MRIQKIVKIAKIVQETPNIRTFRFNLGTSALPGQFLMIWIPGVDEKPMSISYVNDPMGITVMKRGEATSRLFEFKEGDLIGIRGPLGRGFKITGKKLLMVGGGVGISPLVPLSEIATKKGRKVTAIVGACTKDELLFIDRLKNAGVEIIISCDDGSAGIKGFTTDVLKEVLKDREFDQCFTCGPEIMMLKVLEQTREKGIPTQAALDRYVKCGIGICGQCIIDEAGLRVCKEGPVFRDKEVERFGELGRYSRDASGKRIYFGGEK